MGKATISEMELHCRVCRIPVLKIAGRIEEMSEFEIECGRCAEEARKQKR